jgi:hypothetical protein
VNYFKIGVCKDPELTAFDIYLLGHDATAFRTIKFTKVENQTY